MQLSCWVDNSAIESVFLSSGTENGRLGVEWVVCIIAYVLKKCILVLSLLQLLCTLNCCNFVKVCDANVYLWYKIGVYALHVSKASWIFQFYRLQDVRWSLWRRILSVEESGCLMMNLEPYWLKNHGIYCDVTARGAIEILLPKNPFTGAIHSRGYGILILFTQDVIPIQTILFTQDKVLVSCKILSDVADLGTWGFKKMTWID